MKKRFLLKISVFSIIGLGIFFTGLYIYPSLKIACGYAAKYTCSYTFVSDLESGKIQNSFNFFPVSLVEFEIDGEGKTVTASLFGMAERKAFFYQKGKICGCVLDSVDNINRLLNDNFPAGSTGNDLKELPADSLSAVPLNGFNPDSPLPDSLSKKIDLAKLKEVLKTTVDSNPATLAITVAYKNFLVAENYADGVTKDSRLLGWSMTKTMMNSLIGILAKNGTMDIDEKGIVSEWVNDERKEISVNHLMHMSSGLQWNELYSLKTDVTQMLYLEPDIPAFASQKPLSEIPGEKWYYSSGTTNILSGILRQRIPAYSQYLMFPYDSLFDILGMNSALIELDNSGNYIFSSYGWATARDWTRFGLLYLNRGNWFGRQVFSPEWADYSVTPVSSSENKYGAQVWLNQGGKKLSSVPGDAFLADGYGGQKIMIIPSRDLVVVFLSGRQKDFGFTAFYSEVLKCFP